MIVLDASALVDAVLDQPTAGWVLDQIANEEISAPGHQPAEVLSALTRLVRAAQVDLDSARDALDEALALPQRFVTPTARHVRLAFALRDRIRVVDGLYVALADEFECPLVTTDHRLAVADAPCEIHTPPAQPGRPTDIPVPPPRTR
ncbi:MAG: type II toxin-antitoxin system VapC family toxin [Pseudonocardiaceae bacterium]